MHTITVYPCTRGAVDLSEGVGMRACEGRFMCAGGSLGCAGKHIRGHRKRCARELRTEARFMCARWIMPLRTKHFAREERSVRIRYKVCVRVGIYNPSYRIYGPN